MEKEIVKLNKREMLKEKARISYLQILILIVSTFAISYLIAMTDDSVSEIASAQSLTSCCSSDCNDYPSTTCSSECSSTCLVNNKCSDTLDCKLGCCYDKAQGTCAANSPQKSCVSKGGEWKESPECSSNKVPECKLGCCVLGAENEFVTADRCLKLASERGLSADFRAGVTNEASCVFLSISQKRGACLLKDGGCKMLTNQECKSMTGKVTVQDSLCTSTSLNTICEPTENTICIEGKDEVYFVDSCGNAANIYDSDKTFSKSPGYWDKVVSRDNSCGASNLQGNAGSETCGNCNYYLGSKCKNYVKAGVSKPTNGENICADLSCKQAPANVGKEDRRNGESWCVYDGAIGNGDDVPGSRHWKYSCIDGEVKVEPCADFRNEICVQEDTQAGNEKFSSASCRMNNWQTCIEANMGGKNCNGVDCMTQPVNLGKGFNFNMCVPKYPEGFNMKTSDSAGSICGMASQSCTAIWEKGTHGWKCIMNCDCEKETFTKQMNEVCRKLGDCGGEANTEGEYVENYGVSKAPKLSSGSVSGITNLKKPVEGQMAAPETEKLLAMYGSREGNEESGGSSGGGMGMAGIGAGMFAVGVIPAMIGFMTTITVAGNALGFMAAFQLATGGSTVVVGAIGGAGAGALGTTAAAGGTQLATVASAPGAMGALGPVFGAIANALMAAGAAMLVATIMIKVMGLKGQGAQLASYVGMAGAIVIAAGSLGAFGGSSSGMMASFFFGAAFLIVIVIMIIIIIIIKLLGIGKTKKVTSTFTCKPWQPPVGGADCAKCSKDPLKPCSQYRCESLGQACQFVNEGTKDEGCIALEDDGQAPVITPWPEILNGNFTYTNISFTGFQIREVGGGCIQAFTPFLFGIKTNEAAQCKFDVVSSAKFEDMEMDFGSNSIIMNHTMGFSMPSIDAIMSEFSQENLTYKYASDNLGTIRLYTRCQDAFGHYNPTEYVIDVCVKAGPDLTAPYILKTTPENNAFVANGIVKKDLNIYLNEPANCKYSKADKDYSAMENSFSCLTGLQESGLYGWQCNTTLTGLTSTNNTFYFRCQDQPWLEGTINESQRNANVQSYIYKLIVSETPLTITKITPNGSLSFGSEPIAIDLTTETAGGIDGKAECEYSFTGQEGSYIRFYDTYSTSHKQRFSMLTAGEYNMYIKCIDDAGNIAKANTAFDLSVDYSTPMVIRVYRDNNDLFISTNEDSECAYSGSCNFVFENATQMDGGFTREHSTDWTAGKTYYIKCRDAWRNEPTDCSIKIKAYSTEENSA